MDLRTQIAHVETMSAEIVSLTFQPLFFSLFYQPSGAYYDLNRVILGQFI